MQEIINPEEQQPSYAKASVGKGNQEIQELVESPVLRDISSNKFQIPNLRILILVFLGLILLSGITFASYKIGQKKSTSPSQTGVTQTPTPETQNSEQDWKLYQNTDFGFEFKHPPDWKVGWPPSLENTLLIAPSTTISSVEGANWGIDVYFGMFPIEIEKLGSSPKIPPWPPLEIVKKSQTTIADQTADYYELEFSQDDENFSYIKKGRKMLTVVLEREGKFYKLDLTDMEFESIFEQFLSTFKFVGETGNTASWKWFDKYKDLDGYSLKYPSDWTLLEQSEGCGPVFYPPNTTRNWLTICGPYFGLSPQTLADRSVGSSSLLERKNIELDKHEGTRQELRADNGQVNIEIYVGNVPALRSWPDGIEGKDYGTLGIFFYIQDLSKEKEMKEALESILLTFSLLP